MSNKNVLIVAAANSSKVNACINEMSTTELLNATLLTTQKLRVDGIDKYLDAEVKMLSEDLQLSLDNIDRCIVIQHSRTLVPYMNVYKFLRANGIENVAIKTVNNQLVETQVSTLLNNISHSESAQDENVYWVAPSEIEYCAGIDTLHFGQVMDGNWDLQPEPFDTKVSFYPSLTQRFKNGVSWEETDYYKDLMESIKAGEIRFNCYSQSDVITRCTQLEALFLDIQDNGWKQNEGDDYITVNIGREGDLLFADGRHRLSIAKFLKLEKVPVKISVRHQKWQDFKGEIATYAKENGNQVYAPLNHVDLQGFTYNHTDERFMLIADLITKPQSTILDIGSHWGRACAELEDKGHICTAVEGHIGNFYFLNKIRQIDNRKFKAVGQNIFDYIDSPKKFDVVLALNIFHHFTKTESLFEKFKVLLSRLDIDEMFLQTHNPKEPQMIGAYKNFENEEFADFIIQHTGLHRYDFVAEIAAGRKLYHLSK